MIAGYGSPAWAVWLVVLAVSLLRTRPATGEGLKLDWGTGAGALYLATIAPTLFGG